MLGWSPARVGDDLYTLASAGRDGRAVQVRRRRLTGGRGTVLTTLDTPGLTLLVGVVGGPELNVRATASQGELGASIVAAIHRRGAPGLRCRG